MNPGFWNAGHTPTLFDIFAGSLVRPIGGMIADRIGGTRSLLIIYVLAAALLFAANFGIPSRYLALLLFVTTMAVLGMGNGAVFQLVPQRFRKEIGVMTGLGAWPEASVDFIWRRVWVFPNKIPGIIS